MTTLTDLDRARLLALASGPLPGLRKPCGEHLPKSIARDRPHVSRSGRFGPASDCRQCQGRGWVPDATLEGLLDALEKDSRAFAVTFAYNPAWGQPWYCLADNVTMGEEPRPFERGASRIGPTRLSAAYAALVAATGVEPKEDGNATA